MLENPAFDNTLASLLNNKHSEQNNLDCLELPYNQFTLPYEDDVK